MSIHYRCDSCGRDMDRGEDAVQRRIRRRRGVVVVEIMVGTAKAPSDATTWNAGNVCVECVEQTVANGDVA